VQKGASGLCANTKTEPERLALAFGTVLQIRFLFSGTVAETYDWELKWIEDPTSERAAKNQTSPTSSAPCRGLSKNKDTWRGSTLSTGQKHAISFARASRMI